MNPDELPVYTERQLALRNGQDRPEVWIAYGGIIYEVTGSYHWPKGQHYSHWSGQDLSPELPDAPHGEEVFRDLKVVGRLAGPVTGR